MCERNSLHNPAALTPHAQPVAVSSAPRRGGGGGGARDAARPAWLAAAQFAAVAAASAACFSLFLVSSPWSNLAEVATLRSALSPHLLRCVDALAAPLHAALVWLALGALSVAHAALPLVDALPDAAALLLTELAGLVFDAARLVAAVLRAVGLRFLYLCLVGFDGGLAVAGGALLRIEVWARLAWASLAAADPAGLVAEVAMARPFANVAPALLGAFRTACVAAMGVLEYAVAVLHVAPAAVGVLLVPALFVARAVWRRARRVVITEPPAAYTPAELEARIAALPRLAPTVVTASPLLIEAAAAVVDTQAVSMDEGDALSTVEAKAARVRTVASASGALVERASSSFSASRSFDARGGAASSQATLEDITTASAALAEAEAALAEAEAAFATLGTATRVSGSAEVTTWGEARASAAFSASSSASASSASSTAEAVIASTTSTAESALTTFEASTTTSVVDRIEVFTSSSSNDRTLKLYRGASINIDQ